MNVMILQKLLWNKIYPTGITLLSYQLSEVSTSTAWPNQHDNHNNTVFARNKPRKLDWKVVCNSNHLNAWGYMFYIIRVHEQQELVEIWLWID